MSNSRIKSRIKELRRVRRAAEKAGAGWEYSEITKEIWGLRMKLKGRVA